VLHRPLVFVVQLQVCVHSVHSDDSTEQLHSPCIYPDEKDTVVEAVLVVCREQEDVVLELGSRQVRVQADRGIEDDRVCIVPAVGAVVVSIHCCASALFRLSHSQDPLRPLFLWLLELLKKDAQDRGGLRVYCLHEVLSLDDLLVPVPQCMVAVALQDLLRDVLVAAFVQHPFPIEDGHLENARVLWKSVLWQL
jgi:hypothetical protein